MLRVSLIGPGDIEFHYQNLLGISKEKLESELEKIAKVLAETEVELELLPDKGICFELAKEYKKQGGKNVIGSVPLSDSAYGINHLKPQMEEKVNGKNVFDKFINTGDWRQQNRLKGLLGDFVLYLGKSPGAELEANYGIYLFKIMKGFKQGLTLQYLHPEIRASKNIPYTFFVYSPFIKNRKLYPETEAYMKKYGINLVYIKNSKGLKEKLIELQK